MHVRSSIIRDIAISTVIGMLEGRSGKSHRIKKAWIARYVTDCVRSHRARTAPGHYGSLLKSLCRPSTLSRGPWIATSHACSVLSGM